MAPSWNMRVLEEDEEEEDCGVGVFIFVWFVACIDWLYVLCCIDCVT